MEINFSPLSIQRPLGFGSPNDRNDQVPIDQQTGDHQQPQSGARVAVNVEPEAENGLDPEAGDSLLSEPMRYAGWLSFLENFILGPNQSNQIWRLRLLSGISFYMAAVVGFLFYTGNIPKAHVPYHYQMVLLIASVGVPIAVATFSLFVSFWLEFVPNRRSNWITGLSIANFIMLCGPLVIFWSHKWEAETKRWQSLFAIPFVASSFVQACLSRYISCVLAGTGWF